MTEQLEGQAKVRVDEARRAWRTRRARVSSGRQRVARTRAFLAEVATAEMESAFGQALASDLGREEDAPSYAKRLENALAHDSTEVLDDDLDLAPLSM